MSYCGMELPFKLYSFKYIWDELNKNKNLFGSIVQVNDADNKKITKCCNLEQHTRFFTYIKFCIYDGKRYGIVGGKTNYTAPDIRFDKLNNLTKKDNRYARNFLRQKDIEWDKTIIIVNHKPTNSDEEDNQAALFLECYLQRKFNLFES